jgi:hypothetical protein
MQWIIRMLVGCGIGAVAGLAIERTPAKPLAQSFLATTAGWVLGSFTAAAMWLKWPPPGGDVLAVSVGVSEAAIALLIVLACGYGAHVGLGWAGSALHPGLAVHRALILAVLGAALGTVCFTLGIGAAKPVTHVSGMYRR